ncbi:thioesterase family protein [Alphaproteobacteria bacterium]|nr:thioesterase family protein [Alphaproteobacteria bacterium]
MKKIPSNRSEYNYFTKVSTRWNDNDIYGHMNNIIYYALFDTAVNKWLINNKLIDIKNGKNIGLIVQSGCDYFSSFSYPDDIDAGIRVTKIGTSSVRYEVGLFKETEQNASADGFFIHVYVDRKTNIPLPIDYNFNKALDTIFVEL